MTDAMGSRPTRRRFLATAGAAALVRPLPASLVSRPKRLPSPDFSRVKGFVAGIRPYRRGSFRLEVARLGERILVHNYGHGGAGVTLSWGCAEEVLRLLKPALGPRSQVAVLGGGVMGLTTASLLVQKGHQVTVHAAAYSPDTTSDVAGAQWAPSLVNHGRSDVQRERYRRILSSSHRRFLALAGAEYGIREIDNYTTRRRGGSLSRIPRGLIPPPRRIGRLPFEGPPRRGACYRTLLVEPPIFLPRLMHQLRERGVTFHTRRFEAREQIEALDARVIVNCLGLGAGSLFQDSLMLPIRGQLVLLEPQDLDYLLTHGQGYIFPRRDAVLLGGTSERGTTDTDPVAPTCRRILARNRRFFLS